ncbi:hypothetical protein GW17_00053993 [Ensete ventricosum]|nr:hypothetical protein GW17_00053993 [Ensete ventricosum]
MRKLVHIDQGWDVWLGLVLGLGDLYLGRQLRLLFSQVRSEDHERIGVGVLDVTPPMLKSVPREDLVSVLKKSSSPLFLPSSEGFILTSQGLYMADNSWPSQDAIRTRQYGASELSLRHGKDTSWCIAEIVLVGDRGPGSRQWCTNSSKVRGLQELLGDRLS